MPDIPAEAVEAAALAMRAAFHDERWLAEVEEALRMEAARIELEMDHPSYAVYAQGFEDAADYLRDVFGAGAGGEQ